MDISKVHTKRCVCGNGYNPECEAHYPGEHKYLERRTSWVKWLQSYGAEKFYDAFMESAQFARSQCVFCHEPIYLDIAEGGGVPDWRTEGGDYGCSDSPDTCEEGTGGHFPEKIDDEATNPCAKY